MKIHFTYRSDESCSGKPRSRRAACWQAGARRNKECPGRKLTQLFVIMRTQCCPACIIHIPSKGEMRGKCFPFHYFTKTRGEERSLVQPKTWALALWFSCFHTQSLPCRCSYRSWRAAVMTCAHPAGQPNWANFNLAVGYLEPGSHRSANFWASSVLTQPQWRIMLIHLGWCSCSSYWR